LVDSVQISGVILEKFCLHLWLFKVIYRQNYLFSMLKNNFLIPVVLEINIPTKSSDFLCKVVHYDNTYFS